MVLCLSSLHWKSSQSGTEIFPKHLGSRREAQTPAAHRAHSGGVALHSRGRSRCFLWLQQHIHGLCILFLYSFVSFICREYISRVNVLSSSISLQVDAEYCHVIRETKLAIVQNGTHCFFFWLSRSFFFFTLKPLFSIQEDHQRCLNLL